MADPESVKTDAKGELRPGSKPKTQWVVSGRDDARVALWEPDDVHPNGEAFVAGKVPEEVALTAEVSNKLRMGELREATEAEISKRQSQLKAASAPPAKGPWD